MVLTCTNAVDITRTVNDYPCRTHFVYGHHTATEMKEKQLQIFFLPFCSNPEIASRTPCRNKTNEFFFGFFQCYDIIIQILIN